MQVRIPLSINRTRVVLNVAVVVGLGSSFGAGRFNAGKQVPASAPNPTNSAAITARRLNFIRTIGRDNVPRCPDVAPRRPYGLTASNSSASALAS